MECPKIIKLENEVINRIAAGEVVQRPFSVVKELIENSIDAGATNISVTVKQGGLGMIQIQDNGHGIRKDDLEIVCERFTTSKLKVYDDLKAISTFGFRGEALASITHIAQLQIVTRTKDSPYAFRCKYSNGKLIPLSKNESKAEPKPCAGLVGTIITVEDLFYNMPIRKKAFKNLTEEYNKILEVIQKYSIEYSSTERPIVFSCRKADGSNNPAAMNNSDYLSSSTGRCLENIRLCFGDVISKELVDLNMQQVLLNDHSVPTSHPMIYGDIDTTMTTAGTTSYTPLFSNEPLFFSITGKISKALTQLKKSTIVLFINGRLVENTSIKKLIDHIYQEILPKHTFPFAYLSIQLPSHCVDVNVHPTKREVHFLYEDVVLYRLHEECMKLLMHVNESRMFKVQTVLPFQATTTGTVTASNNIAPDSMLGNNLNQGGKISPEIGNAPQPNTSTGVSDKLQQMEMTTSNKESSESFKFSPMKKPSMGITLQAEIAEREEYLQQQTQTLSKATTTFTSPAKSAPVLMMESFLPTPVNPNLSSMSANSVADDVISSKPFEFDISHVTTTSAKKRKDISSSSSSTGTVSANKMVRVDSSMSKLPLYFQRIGSQTSVDTPTANKQLQFEMVATSSSVPTQQEDDVLQSEELYCQEISSSSTKKAACASLKSQFLIQDDEEEDLAVRNVAATATTAKQHYYDPASNNLTQCLCCPPFAILSQSIASKQLEANDRMQSSSGGIDLAVENGANNNAMNNNFALPTISMIIQSPVLLTELDEDIQKHFQELAQCYQHANCTAESSLPELLQQDLSISRTLSSTFTFPLVEHLYHGHHTALWSVWKSAIYVGSVNAQYGLFQYQTKLYLFPYYPILSNFFYTYALLQFPFYHILQLSPTLDLMTLLREGARQCHQGQQSVKLTKEDQKITLLCDGLMQHAYFLSTRFQIAIHPSTRQVESIPDLLPGYTPSAAQLGSFFYLLASYVQWENGKETDPEVIAQQRILQVCQVIGWYFALLPTSSTMAGSSASSSVDLTEEAKEQVEHVLFPMVKRYYLPSSSRTLPFPHTVANHAQMLVELTSLEQLYKVFERC